MRGVVRLLRRSAPCMQATISFQRANLQSRTYFCLHCWCLPVCYSREYARCLVLVAVVERCWSRDNILTGVVCLFVRLFVHEGMVIMVWENGGTLMRRECVMDSYGDSYRNRTTKRRSLWCEYHVGCVHDQVMYSLFENVSNRRSGSSQGQCTMVQL